MRCAVLVVFAVLAVIASASSSLKLEKIVFFTRHGIRVPFPPPEGAANYSLDSRQWYPEPSQWGAGGVAFLTAHGAAVLTTLGQYYQQLWLEGSNPFLNNSCDALQYVTVYADDDSTERDVLSAQAFFAGLFPDCSVTINHEPEYSQWLFNTGSSSMNSACVLPPQQVVDGTMGNATFLSRFYEDAIRELNGAINCCESVICTSAAQQGGSGSQDMANYMARKVVREAPRDVAPRDVTPEQKHGKGGAACALMELPTQWTDVSYQLYNGPIFTAGILTEYIQLLYLNNMDYTTVLNLTAFEIERLVAVHTAAINVAENYWATQMAGSQLLAHLVATMDQILYGVANSYLVSQASDKLVFYAGHDINIHYLRNFLRVNWITDSYNPNQAPPSGHLIFELYSNDNQEYFLKLFMETQSNDQQRNNTPLSASSPPSKVFVAIPACTNGPENSCSYDTFRKLALQALNPLCVNFPI